MIGATLEPEVTYRQELIVPLRTTILGRMDEKAAFSKRLNEICDDKDVPPKGENRQSTLGKKFGVSQKGARKWLEGEGFPSIEKLIAIAKWGDIAFEWLVTGRGSKDLPEENLRLRPDLKRLMSAAEELPSYKVDQTILIMAAIKDDPVANDADAPKKRSAG